MSLFTTSKPSVLVLALSQLAIGLMFVIHMSNMRYSRGRLPLLPTEIAALTRVIHVVGLSYFAKAIWIMVPELRAGYGAMEVLAGIDLAAAILSMWFWWITRGPRE